MKYYEFILNRTPIILIILIGLIVMTLQLSAIALFTLIISMINKIKSNKYICIIIHSIIAISLLLLAVYVDVNLILIMILSLFLFFALLYLYMTIREECKDVRC